MILTARNLTCRRGGRVIFSNVSFQVRSGQALVLTGDNGAGKSSLLATIAGLLPAEAGEVAYAGDAATTLGEAIGLMAHKDGLKNALTVSENLEHARRLLGAGSRSIADSLHAVNMGHTADMPVEFLSAGQRRRVALARLLTCNRAIWLMDEPAGALDAASVRTLTQIMNDHLGAGGLIVAATHQPLGLTPTIDLHLAPPADIDDGYWEDDDVDDEALIGYAERPDATGAAR